MQYHIISYHGIHSIYKHKTIYISFVSRKGFRDVGLDCWSGMDGVGRADPLFSLGVPPFGFHSGFLGLRPLDVCRGFNVFIARTFMEDAVNGMISRFSIVVAA